MLGGSVSRAIIPLARGWQAFIYQNTRTDLIDNAGSASDQHNVRAMAAAEVGNPALLLECNLSDELDRKCAIAGPV